jgi:hypothetical protein
MVLATQVFAAVFVVLIVTGAVGYLINKLN